MTRTRTILCLLLLFSAHLLSALSGAEGDSTKNKSRFPITDPRNPNCPCHQYQAEADREYAKLLRKSGQAGALEVKGEAFEGSKKLGKVRQRRWAWGPARNHKSKAQKKKAFKDRLSRCFHF